MQTRDQKEEVKEAALSALTSIFEQLLELVFETGVSVKETCYLLRACAVYIAERQMGRQSERPSKSRIAIMTGLPRSEVARALNSKRLRNSSRRVQQPTTRVLGAWFADPRFLANDGEPKILPIFGKRRSFEQLVREHGSGVPVRAMLDALTELKAVEVLPDQMLRAKSRIPIRAGLSAEAVTALGTRCSDLLRTLIANLNKKDHSPFFEAMTASEIDEILKPIVRRDLEKQLLSAVNSGSSILRRANLNRRVKHLKRHGQQRVGIAVHYFEEPMTIAAPPEKTRRNLRRHVKRSVK